MPDETGNSTHEAPPDARAAGQRLGTARSSDDYNRAPLEKVDQEFAQPETKGPDAVTSIYLRFHDSEHAVDHVVSNLNSPAPDTVAIQPSTGPKLERPVLIGHPVLSEERPPPEWGKAFAYAVFATGLAITMLFLLSFDAAFFGEKWSQTSSIETAITTLPSEAGKAQMASKLVSGSDAAAATDTDTDTQESEPIEEPSMAWDLPTAENIDFDDKLLRFDAISESGIAFRDPGTAGSDREVPSEPLSNMLKPVKRDAISDITTVGAAQMHLNSAIEALPNTLPAEAAPTTGVTALPTGLAVTRMILTRGIANKEPIDEASRFAASDDAIFAFASFANPDAPTQVTFIWYHGDRLVDATSVTIGQSKAWRSWSKRRIQAGNWRVEIIDESGEILAAGAFIVD